MVIVYYVETEQLESDISIGMTDGCDDFKSLTDDQLRSFLQKEAVDSETIVTESDLSAMAEKNVRMDMKIKSATGCMKFLFMNYQSLLRQHGMAWVTEKNQNAAVYHVLSVIKPKKLKKRL